MKALALACAAVSFGVRPLPQPEGPLEPSVQNEVDHAIALAERWLAARPDTNGVASAACFATNGLTRQDVALKLVSAQRGAGWWVCETNAAPTRRALEILKGL